MKKVFVLLGLLLMASLSAMAADDANSPKTFRQNLKPNEYAAYVTAFTGKCYEGCSNVGKERCQKYCDCVINTISDSTYTLDKIDVDLTLVGKGDTSNALHYILQQCIEKEISK